MKVIVDTSVWSLALRRSILVEDEYVLELKELIKEARVQLIEDYESAAKYFNMAGKRGIQGSNTDFLICALSTRYKMPILTTDNDFINFQAVLPVELHKIR